MWSAWECKHSQWVSFSHYPTSSQLKAQTLQISIIASLYSYMQAAIPLSLYCVMNSLPWALISKSFLYFRIMNSRGPKISNQVGFCISQLPPTSRIPSMKSKWQCQIILLFNWWENTSTLLKLMLQWNTGLDINLDFCFFNAVVGL